MTGSFIVKDGGRLLLIGSGEPSRPKPPPQSMTRAEVADLFSVPETHAEHPIFRLNEATGRAIRSATVAGEVVYNRDDVLDAMAERDRRRREPKPPRQSKAPTPASAPSRIELADDYVATAGVDRTRAAISVADAAKAAGLDPEDMQNLLLGRAKLGVKDGEIMVRVADLDRLGKQGVIPSPTEAERVRHVTEAVESGGKPADPDLERRVREAADAIGLDRSEVGIERNRNAADRRAADIAERIGLDYPERT